MPSKSISSPRKILHPDGSTEQVFDIIGIGDSSDASVIMTAIKPARRGKSKGKAEASSSAIPGVYREMLAEALPMRNEDSERPLKRRRTGRRTDRGALSSAGKVDVEQNDQDDEEDLEFEDVLGRGESGRSGSEESNGPPKRQQTAYRESDDDSASDFDWDTIDFDAKPQEEPSGDLELTLAKRPTPQRKASATRRRVISKDEKVLRLQIHKMHVLCLLAYIERRNDWCSDSDAQSSLKPLVTKKILTLLKPRSDLSQFGRTDSLKRGLDDVGKMWRTKFSITERGMRRSLWADDEMDLQNYNLPNDADSAFEKSDFRAAAKSLKGSRDLGAQLYCTLLRSVGVEARLVCSLQTLSFNASGPPMPRSSAPSARPASPETSDDGEAVDVQSEAFVFGSPSESRALPFSAQRRLGHPNAAAYHMPDMSAPARPPPKQKAKAINESQYPVIWVEVLDEAHQKWFPVDPLVTGTIAKPRSFEPPASDRENAMSYVIAFEDEGSARDVTRRYTKAYNAKTRKSRVESTHGGDRWWRRTMRAYERGWKSDLEQIEDNELSGIEAREPMPRNVADFKDHPYYALERHLRRNEILISTHEVGKVAAGREAGTQGKKKLENIYRRRDVKIVRSADAWYRLGKEIKMGEQPVKTVAPKRRPDDEELGGGMEERPGTNLYTEDQTELYEAPPIVNGRVPKNSYGNLDIFVSSMVPPGGVHLPFDEASRAARILGIDYADALTGFEFRGRHGTAVLKGIVIASEYREAAEAIIEGFQDERAQAEEDRRTIAALRMWKRFLVSLRIKERVDTYEIEGEEGADHELQAEDNDSGMDTEEYDDDEAGGFFPE